MDFKDIVQRYIDSKVPIKTKFLTLTEQQIIHNTLSKKVYFTLYGGYMDAERKRASIHSDEQDDITCFQIYYNEKYLTLSHQNILGTLLSLSIQRESIGDILPKQGVFFVTSEIKEYVYLEFNQINHVSITLEEINGAKVQSEKELERHQMTVASLRLDLLVSKITKQSRNAVEELLAKEFVHVNHLPVTKGTKKIQQGDVISIRKFGRFLLLDTSGISRKGKIVVKYGKFI